MYRDMWVRAMDDAIAQLSKWHNSSSLSYFAEFDRCFSPPLGDGEGRCRLWQGLQSQYTPRKMRKHKLGGEKAGGLQYFLKVYRVEGSLRASILIVSHHTWHCGTLYLT